MAYLKQQRKELPRPKGAQKINERGSNGVEESGGYGGATLHTPGTHAPALLDGNTPSRPRRPVNSIVPNSPVGKGGTFDDVQNSAPHVDFGKFKAVAGAAKKNLAAKASSKVITEHDDAGPGVQFKGMKTAGLRAKAEDYHNGLKPSYEKKGAHGAHKTAV